ncbi:MAG: hypothetical protein ACOH2K_15920 [Burkholderiaceae bacterium]
MRSQRAAKNGGSVSRKQANAYAHFAAQRRALLEAEGAERNVKMLEAAIKVLSQPQKKGK